MRGYDVVLFLHLLALVGAFAGIGLIHYGMLRLRAAREVAGALAGAELAGRAGAAMPLAALGLFGTGAYLVSDRWSWGDSWVVLAIAGLVAIEALGGGIMHRRGDAVERALREARTLTPELAARLRDPLLWSAAHTTTALAVGVMLVMATKPGWGTGIAVLVIAAAAGVLSAVPLWRVAAEPATSR